ncbi:hypothetical protein GCM10020367_45100 [Streptomyces sannanensis]|uniref:Uncharacterized protein n=1 Tax=Streptomyces sannanensis TaxID=285536 RepID=A0ABP6SGF4_9ACTN
MPVGTITGELLAGSRLGPAAGERLVVPPAAVRVLPFLRPGLPVAVAVLVLCGLGQWYVDAVPEELRGRAMTLMTAGMMNVQGVGTAVAGRRPSCCPRIMRSRSAASWEPSASWSSSPSCCGPKYETGLTGI